MNSQKESYLKYGITTLVGVVITLAVCWARGLFSSQAAVDTYRILCDGCFVSAVLLIGVGLMVLVSNTGAFDILNYGVRSFFGIFSKEAENRKPEGSFIQYKERKAAQKSPYLFLVLVGCGFLAVAFVFVFLYSAA